MDYVTRAAPAAQRGTHLMLSFWAWGRSEDDCMISLGRVLTNLQGAVREVDTDAR